MKKILGTMRKAIEDFQLIEEGDKIGVGVSGGKDSMLLLKALKTYQQFSPINFQLEAFTINLGFENFDTKTIKDYCDNLGIIFNLKNTNIKDIVFHVREEKNPCSLCSNMRKGALNNFLKEKGFNKLALGHHSDDAIETFFLNMFYGGKLKTFSAKTFLTRKEIYIIRPFIYLSEKEIINTINNKNIPTIKNPCYVDKKLKEKKFTYYLIIYIKKYPIQEIEFLQL